MTSDPMEAAAKAFTEVMAQGIYATTLEDGLQAALAAHTDAAETERDQKADHISGLQAALVVIEQACHKEGQTVEGLSRACRRAVQEFLDGKNPAQKVIAERDAMAERVAELEEQLGAKSAKPLRTALEASDETG